MTLEIECDAPEFSVCECCGHENLNLFRTIHNGEEAVAVYMVTLPAHAGFPVSVLLITGRLDDDASPEERFAMTFQIVRMENQYGTGVTEPADEGWEEVGASTLLSKKEAMARFSKEIFAFSDLIVSNDPMIRSYLESSLTHAQVSINLH